MSKTLRRHASWFAILSVVMFAVALAPRDASAQACAARPGYPLGRWGVVTRGATPATYSTFITFTQPTSGTWLPASGKGTFETSGPHAPGKAVVITLSVEGGPYKSENQRSLP